MPDAADTRAPLVDGVQDLREGEAATLERLPKAAEAAGSGFGRRGDGTGQDRFMAEGGVTF